MLHPALLPPVETLVLEPLVPSQTEDLTKLPSSPSSSTSDRRKARQKWSEEETEDLMEGCRKHGVGAWKKILSDPELTFHTRSAVDLKDRFRTAQPDEYQRLYPNSRRTTTKHTKADEGSPIPEGRFRRVARRPRNAFSKEEDEELFQAVTKYGCAWAKIAKDGDLKLTHRRSTDLRDRFRNAFPEYYTHLGYVPKPRSKTAQKLALTPDLPDGLNMPNGFNMPNDVNMASGVNLPNAVSIPSGVNQIAYYSNDLNLPYAAHGLPNALPHVEAAIAAAIVAAEAANFSESTHNPHHQHHQQQFPDALQHNLNLKATLLQHL